MLPVIGYNITCDCGKQEKYIRAYQRRFVVMPTDGDHVYLCCQQVVCVV